MKEVIDEYGGMVIAAVMMCYVVVIFSGILLGQNCALAQLIQYWGNGGC